VRNVRENFLLSAVILIVLGAMISLGADMIMGIIMGFFGVICFIIGMSTSSKLEISTEAVREWTPTMEQLPDAGRFMYRVDVTMDEPYRSSILCGPCGHLEVVDGKRPNHYTCVKCNRQLWDTEEE
jgi:hypothetical protein